MLHLSPQTQSQHDLSEKRTLPLCSYLVQSSKASKDDMRGLHLDHSLSQPHQVGTNANGTASDHGVGCDFPVRL